MKGSSATGFGPGLAGTPALDPKTVALLQVGVSVATGSPAVCLEWSTTRAMAAGATKDEVADVLLAIAPVAGLGRVVAAAASVATALGITSRPRWKNQIITNRSPARWRMGSDTGHRRARRQDSPQWGWAAGASSNTPPIGRFAQDPHPAANARQEAGQDQRFSEDRAE